MGANAHFSRPLEPSRTQFYRIDIDLPTTTLTLWFSYRTLVGFGLHGKLTVRENTWGPVTGKHLRYIDGGDKEAKSRRLSKERFEEALASALRDFGLNTASIPCAVPANDKPQAVASNPQAEA